MPARILHFGQESCHRLPVLQNAGYSVSRCHTLVQLRDALQSAEQPHAVSMTDTKGSVSAEAILSARSCSSAALILFRNPNPRGVEFASRSIALSDFDLVIPALARAPKWLTDIAALLGRLSALHGKPGPLSDQPSELQEESLLLGEEPSSANRNGRNFPARTGPRSLAVPDTSNFLDRILVCSDCGMEFVFSAGEQAFFSFRGFQNDPKHCKQCRAERLRGAPRTPAQTRQSCAACGVTTLVPFKPTQGRPVFCRPCLTRKSQ